jgi:hypothetical protein
VSTGDIYWSPLIKDDLTAVTRNGTPTHQGRWRGNCPSHITSSSCNPIEIIFTNRGVQDGTWETGKTWGRQYPNSGSHPGRLFTIVLQKEVLNSPEPIPIGPNPVLIPPVIPRPATITPMTPKSATTVQEHHSPGIYSHNKSLPFSHYPIWELMTKTFEVLNSSQPNLTKECWLCLNAQPPFYTGVAIMGNHTRINLTHCSWGLNGKLSLQQEQGLVFGPLKPSSL